MYHVQIRATRGNLFALLVPGCLNVSQKVQGEVPTYDPLVSLGRTPAAPIPGRGKKPFKVAQVCDRCRSARSNPRHTISALRAHARPGLSAHPQRQLHKPCEAGATEERKPCPGLAVSSPGRGASSKVSAWRGAGGRGSAGRRRARLSPRLLRNTHSAPPAATSARPSTTLRRGGRWSSRPSQPDSRRRTATRDA